MSVAGRSCPVPRVYYKPEIRARAKFIQKARKLVFFSSMLRTGSDKPIFVCPPELQCSSAVHLEDAPIIKRNPVFVAVQFTTDLHVLVQDSDGPAIGDVTDLDRCASENDVIPPFSADHVRIDQVRTSKVRAIQVRTSQVRTRKTSTLKSSIGKDSINQVSIGQFCTGQVRTGKTCTSQACTQQVRVSQVCTDEVCIG